MRTYIFTDYERTLIKRMLAGERDDAIWKLMHRIRTFDELRADVSLFREAAEAAATKK
jgi:hypothetical protein